MPSRSLPGLGLTGFWDLGATYKTGMDDNLRRLSALVQAGAISQTTALPASPSAGDIYIVPAGAASNANDLAIYDGPAGSEAWVYLTPVEGWTVYVQDISAEMRFDGTAWQEIAEGGGSMTGAQIVSAIDTELGSTDWQGGGSGGTVVGEVQLDATMASAGHTLSDNDQTLINTGGGSDYRNWVTATKALPGDHPVPFYWEFVCNPAGPTEFNGYHGVVSQAQLDDPGFTYDSNQNPTYDGSIGYRGDGGVWADFTLLGGYTAYGAGDIVMIAFDPETGGLWIGLNGTWGDNPDTDPPTEVSSTPGVTFWPVVQGREPGEGGTLRSLSSQFSYSVPSTCIALGESYEAAPVSALTDLSDVDDLTETDGHVLTRQADGSYAFEAVPTSGGGALDDLSDVDTTGASTGHVLTRQADGSYAFEAVPTSGGSVTDGNPSSFEVCVANTSGDVSGSGNALKGNIISVTEDRYLTEVLFGVFGNPSQDITLGVAEVASADPGEVVSVLLEPEVVTATDPGDEEPFVLPSPILLEAGKFYAIYWIRYDGAATAACQVYFENDPGTTDGFVTFHEVVRETILVPTAGDTLHYSTTSQVGMTIVTEGVAGGGASPSGLTDLSDVDDLTETEGHVLTRQADGSYAFEAVPTSGGGALNDLSDVDTTGASTGQVLKRQTDGSYAFEDESGGGGGGALDDLSDVDFAHGNVTSDMIGRPLGVTQISPSPKVSVLDQLKALPISGGIDLLVENDFTTNPIDKVTVPDVHLYDEVHFYWFGVDGTDALYGGIYPDGVNPASYSHTRMRAYDPGSGIQAAVTDETGADKLFISSEASNNSGQARWRGMKSGLPLSVEKVAGNTSPLYFHHEHDVYETLAEVRGLSFETGTGNMTGGYFFAVGVRHAAQPVSTPFDYSGSPAGAETLGRFICPVNARIRSGVQGYFKMASNPTAETTLNIDLDGVTVGTITLPTTGDPTVSIAADTDISAGDILTIEATANGDFTDLYGSLIVEGRG